MGIKFIVDEVSDLPEEVDQTNISVVKNSIILKKKGEREIEFHGLTADNFKDKVDGMVMHGHYIASTSMPVIYEAEDEEKYGVMSVERLTKELLKDNDVVFLATNSTITSVYSGVSMLYRDLAECRDDYDGHLAICIDTQCASTGLALLIRNLTMQNFTTVEEVVDYVNENAGRIGHVFTWRNLTYIKNSGKVRGGVADLANLIKITPLGSVEYVGDERPLEVISKMNRGYKKAAMRLARFVKATIVEAATEVVVAHGNDPEFAAEVERRILEELPNVKILHWRCGPTIQAHGGPTSIHVNYLRKYPNSFEETKRIMTTI